jgi:hypothetical protein
VPNVRGFLPSTCAFHFANAFDHVPTLRIQVLGHDIALGDAANGLCGGMAYAVRDLFQDGRQPPPDTDPPSKGPLFDYLVERLFASFDLPGGVLTYLHLMSPGLPDGETWLSEHGLAPHGRAWVTVREQWPRIRRDLDQGRLSPLGLVQVKSPDPRRLGVNHQVLAYGYQTQGAGGSVVTLRVYDPNLPDRDDVTFTFETAHPDLATKIDRSDGDLPLYAFFRTRYRPRKPPQLG